MQIHKRKGHLKLLCSLTRQGKNCHPAHSFLFINIMGGYMLNQSWALYTVRPVTSLGHLGGEEFSERDPNF